MGVNERERGTNGAVRSPSADTIQEAAPPPLATAASTVFVFLWRDGTAKEAEKPQFPLSAFNNPPFSRSSRYSAVYFCGSQYRWRGMNKLSIRVKAESYTEVTCFLSAVLKRAEQRGMCPASPNGPIINGQPSESAWIIYNPPPPPLPCWAAQSEVLHFKQRGRRIRCAILSAPSRFRAPASPLISIQLENRWWWSKCGYSDRRAPSERAAVPPVVSRGVEKTQREPLKLLPAVRDPAAAFVSSHHRGRRSKTGALLQYLVLWWFVSVSSGLKSSSTLRSGFIPRFAPKCPPPVLLWPSPSHGHASNIPLIFVPQLWCLLNHTCVLLANLWVMLQLFLCIMTLICWITYRHTTDMVKNAQQAARSLWYWRVLG